MKRLLTSAALLVCLAAGLSAQTQTANLRIVHAVADAPAVDVYANGALVVEALPFKAATGYLSVPAGSYQVEVNVSGTSTTVIRDHFTLAAGVDYSSIAVGSVENGMLRLLTIGDNLLPREEGTIRVRVIHAAASAPAVDLYLGAPYAPVSTVDPLLESVPFGAQTGHMDFPNGLYQGRVTVSGTKTIAIETDPLRLPDKAVRTFIAVDAAGGGAPFQIITLLDEK